MKRLLSTFIATLLFSFTVDSLAANFTAHCRHYPPGLTFDGEKCIGPVPDLVTDILNELGHEIVWQNVPWIRSIQFAKTGDVDLLIRHSMTEERTLFLEAMPYGQYLRQIVFYKAPNFNAPIHSYADIKKHNVGAVRGNFYSPTFTLIDPNTLTLVKETQQLADMLQRGRIDLAVTSKLHNEDLYKGKFVKAQFVDEFYNSVYISIPKTSTQIGYFDDIKQLLLKYRKAGLIKQYFKKYNLPAPKQIFE